MKYILAIIATVIVAYGWCNYNKQNQAEVQEATESIESEKDLVSPCYINKKNIRTDTKQVCIYNVI